MKDHNERKVAIIPGFQGIDQITPEAINEATKEGKDHNERKVAIIPGFQGIDQITPEAINEATKEGKPGPPKAYRSLLYLLNILSNLYEIMIKQGFGEMRFGRKSV
ncbi:hypothetical protein QE152_g10301 [Popillia japonica]|uniref:Uncharacterized protein n=1 Tax=Popillia japonica TaxID=7064 RepID=A0AAW1LRW6_POPJA